MSGLADVSVCDGDPNIFESSVGDPQTDKYGRLMVRTELGTKVVKKALDMNMLELWAASNDEFNLGLERKRNRRAFYEQTHPNIPLPPITGHVEDIDIVDDEYLLKHRRKMED